MIAMRYRVYVCRDQDKSRLISALKYCFHFSRVSGRNSQKLEYSLSQEKKQNTCKYIKNFNAWS